MFYLYFSYVLIVSCSLYSFFVRKKKPVWWAIFSFFAPVTAPYFFFKASLKKRFIFTIFFYLGLVLVCGGEFYLFSKEKVEFKLANYSPAARHMIQLSDELKNSTAEFDNAIKELESMSKVVSKPTGIAEALSFIGTVRVKMIKNRSDVKQFIAFSKDYKAVLEKEGFDDIFFMEDFFTNPVVVVYLKSLEDYLESFETLLNYTLDNFNNIEAKSPVHIQNYDAYYMKYRQAVDRHNRLCVKRIEFQKTIVEKHPGLEQYLPTMIQTDFLKLWE